MMDQQGKATFTKCISFSGTHMPQDHNIIDFVWMCTLDDMKGVQIGNTYRNDKQLTTSRTSGSDLVLIE